MHDQPRLDRHLGLTAATGVGVGAIVGGGILALAGVAFAATGPSAIIAFALNGLIAMLTAFSFAEMASRFPESGGTYTFAKKALSVEAAFTVGWVVWFASIVAAVLYAVGFAHFALLMVDDLAGELRGAVPGWSKSPLIETALAIATTIVLAVGLMRSARGGGAWANVGKVVVFGVLIAAGGWAVVRRPPGELVAGLRPFFSGGAIGLIQAMGYTFIALQGFDLIAAVGGEVREPARNIPRAMIFSLTIALAIYVPLLLIIATVGVPVGDTVARQAAADPEDVVPLAAARFVGPFGYWLVIVAAVLSMFSALRANLFAASRIAQAMAADRTLPALLRRVDPKRGTPVVAVLVTSGIVCLMLVALNDVAAAGAAASLIFLLTFALAHWIAILIRQRSAGVRPPFCTPWFPAVPAGGAVACVALAVFQGVAVPSAGVIAATWLAVGGLLFLGLFARRARVADASSMAMNPDVVRLRGRSPLVLVPLANPANAPAMVALADALAPRNVGRVLLLAVVRAAKELPASGDLPQLTHAQLVLREALAASLRSGMCPEALTTVAEDPWAEIARVARTHRCESLLLGLSDLSTDEDSQPLADLMSSVDTDVVVLRSYPGWDLSAVRRVLVPIGGRGGHDALRARLLGSLCRTGARTVTYLRVLPERTPESQRLRAERDLAQLGHDETGGLFEVRAAASADPAQTVTEYAEDHDLIVLGVQRLARRRKAFGHFTMLVARRTSCPILMISRGG